ncbi:unnamed protein product [Vicia faba]|uniref:Uncharacterized protein n=1 Tax=Vicia faba TaxID=3906 RepID=A0AAV1AW86_VICFA|nr:unnamed protein product [Vicia faba]
MPAVYYQGLHALLHYIYTGWTRIPHEQLDLLRALNLHFLLWILESLEESNPINNWLRSENRSKEESNIGTASKSTLPIEDLSPESCSQSFRFERYLERASEIYITWSLRLMTQVMVMQCFDPTEEQHQDDNMTQDSSRVDQILLAIPALSAVRTVDEPYMGHEFVSRAEAHVFYNAYATRVGFVIRGEHMLIFW